MSREIKFRAWDTRDKEMVYRAEHSYDCGAYYSVDISVSCFGELLDDDRYIVEQYTGLKDRNGKEIYEGDIIRYGGQVSEVKFDEMKDSDCSYYYLGWAMKDLSLYEHNTLIEVIGNIHENPELLEEEK